MLTLLMMVLALTTAEMAAAASHERSTSEISNPILAVRAVHRQDTSHQRIPACMHKQSGSRVLDVHLEFRVLFVDFECLDRFDGARDFRLQPANAKPGLS